MPRRKLEQPKEPKKKKEKQEETKSVYCNVHYYASAYIGSVGTKPPPCSFKLSISTDAIEKIENKDNSFVIHLICCFDIDFPEQVKVKHHKDGSVLKIRKKKRTHVTVKNKRDETHVKVVYLKH